MKLAEMSPRLKGFLSDPRRLVPVAAIILILGLLALLAAPEGARVGTSTGSEEQAAFGSQGGDSAESLTGGEAATDGLAPGSTKRGTSRAAARPGETVGAGGQLLGRGVTATEIKIGVNISKDLQAGFTAVGATGGSAAIEERQYVETLVKWINANGGLQKRKVVPVFHEYDAVRDGTWAAMAQAACAKFIDDEKVFAAVSGHVGGSDVLLACLAKGNAPLVQQNQWPYDAKYYQDFAGYLYQPSRMTANRFAPIYVDGLREAGYFDAKVGMLRFSGAVFDRLTDMTLKRMATHGLSIAPDDVITINTPQSVSDFGAMGAELNNALLIFQAHGVKNVMFAEYGSIIPFFFLKQAHGSGYTPRYGFNSTNLLGTVQSQSPSPDQLKRAVGVSWLPGQDIFNAAQDPRNDAAFNLCLKIMKDAGIANPSRLYAGTHCDNFFFLKAVIDKADDITVNGFKAAVESLGTSWVSPYTFTTKFGPGRYDGASSWRIAHFDYDGCKCFVYKGDAKPAP